MSFLPCVTVHEYLAMSKDVYSWEETAKNVEAKNLPSWKIWNNALSLFRDENYKNCEMVRKIGFFARAYKKENDGQVVIAYRGTASVRNWGADGALMLDLESPLVDIAVDFYHHVIHKIKNSLNDTPCVTGHSLGGYLAQAICLRGNHPAACVAFNAPQAGGLRLKDSEGDLSLDLERYDEVHNINCVEDLIHRIGDRVGDEILLSPVHDFPYKLKYANILHHHYLIHIPDFMLEDKEVIHQYLSPLQAHRLNELEKRVLAHPEIRDKVF